MQQVVEQLEQFVASFPKSEKICVEQRDCFHLSKDSILSTYDVHKNELIAIFSKYRDYSDRQLRSVTSLVTWDEVSSVFSDDQQYAMGIFLEEELVPMEQKGQYSEFIDTILIHEWGLRIYEKLHKFASREDALTHISNQEKANYMDMDTENN
nr:uncharacterized protein LOC115260497 [Aedes albopictus]